MHNDVCSFAAKQTNLNFHPLEFVSRNRDPQLHVGENDWYLFNLRHLQILLNKHFILNTSDLIGK